VLAAHNSYRIVGAADPAVQAPEALSTAYITSGTSIDPPSLTPTGGAKDYLWLAVSGWRGATLTATGNPTNYTNAIEGNSGGTATTGTRLRSLRRELNAASEDPSAFTLSAASDRRLGVTIAVHPPIPSVDITVRVHHTNASGGDPQLITSASTTITGATADPLALALGSGALQTFTSADPRLLRMEIEVTGVANYGSFVLDYDGTCATNKCSNLNTPVVVVPEGAVALAAVGILIPLVTAGAWRRRRVALRARQANSPFPKARRALSKGRPSPSGPDSASRIDGAHSQPPV
jgi:hypothetical protein